MNAHNLSVRLSGLLIVLSVSSRCFFHLKRKVRYKNLRDRGRGEFRPRQTRQLSRAVDLKGRFLFLVVTKC
jgi:hypothetical protein